MKIKILKSVFFIIIIDILFLILASILYKGSYNNIELGIKYVSLITTIFIIWSIGSLITIDKNILSPNIIFFLSTIFFNCGAILLYCFGEKDIFQKYLYVPQYNIFKAIYITLIATIMLHLGSIVLIKNRKKICVQKNDKFNDYYILGLVGFVLLSVSFLPYLLEVIKMIRNVNNGTYINAYYVDKSVLSTFILPAIIFLLATGEKYRITKYLSLIVLIIYVGPLLYIGRRGQAFVAIISYIWLYDRRIKKINRKLIVIFGCISIFIVMPTISVLRQLQDKSIVEFINTFKSIENPIKFILEESGITFMNTAYVDYLLPSNGHHFGLDYIFAILSSIPNLVYKFNYYNIIGNPGVWITKIMAPNIAAIGGGLGFNYIAEAYLNFSILGVAIIPFLLGFILRKIDNMRNLITEIGLAIFISFLPMYSRGTAYDIFRPTVWYILFPILLFYIIKDYKRKKFFLNTK